MTLGLLCDRLLYALKEACLAFQEANSAPDWDDQELGLVEQELQLFDHQFHAGMADIFVRPALSIYIFAPDRSHVRHPRTNHLKERWNALPLIVQQLHRILGALSGLDKSHARCCNQNLSHSRGQTSTIDIYRDPNEERADV